MKKVSVVFYISVAILALLVLVGITMPAQLETVTSNLQDFITNTFGWYYLIVVTFFVIVCLYLLVSPIGRIKLGKQEDKPEFSRPTWLAMLFSAGMGIGLVFYGTAEPLSHYAISSPTGETGTDQAMKDAMRFTFFHWGIHAWAIYGIIALSLAYFTFRKGERSLISATLKPVIGKYADGVLGKIIDIIAVIATVIGVATTLGFGAVQINGGLSYLFGVPSNLMSQFLIVLVVTILFIISALTGLGKGIKILSNANMAIALVLFLLTFILGPTLFTLNLFTDTVGSYLQNLINMSFRIAPLNEENRNWINGWTIFYWAWWIAWSPFVGIFIARVSKGSYGGHRYYWANGTCGSHRCYWTNGTYGGHRCYWANGTCGSHGCYWTNGSYGGHRCYWANGTCGSHGCYWTNGTYRRHRYYWANGTCGSHRCYWTNGSYGGHRCYWANGTYGGYWNSRYSYFSKCC
ncbi:BCCT family transporter [Priestia filamentosa]|uniref:BCCT family transporter n=1 Tax=Priestia filamentosa TaxID=1402861 RepID=UPI0038574619